MGRSSHLHGILPFLLADNVTMVTQNGSKSNSTPCAAEAHILMYCPEARYGSGHIRVDTKGNRIRVE